jgi:hypothetical protein
MRPMTLIPVRSVRPNDVIELPIIGEVEVLHVEYPDNQHADLEVLRPEHAPEVVILAVGERVETLRRAA